MARKSAWRFAGELDRDGRPLAYFSGIPARDLNAEDVSELSDAGYRMIEVSPLYLASPVAKPAPEKEETCGN
jgi:hypothetical protein